MSTVQARRGVRFKTARPADPARSNPQVYRIFYFTVLGSHQRHTPPVILKYKQPARNAGRGCWSYIQLLYIQL
jgi:hypothetical protein